jgi:hypothetical protein
MKSIFARPALLRVAFATTIFLTVARVFASPAFAEIKDFRDWTAACDNLRDCNAYGVETGSVSTAYVRLERDGGATAALKIIIAVEAQKTSQLKLSFDDSTIAGLPSGPQPGTESADNDDKRLVISDPVAVEAALAGLRKAKKLVITRIDPAGAPASDPATSEISLSGLAAALLWIDDRQKRVGTVTALIAKGGKPASVIVAPPVPVVTAAKPSSSTPQKPPAAALAKAQKECDSTKKFTDADDATPLGAGKVMYWFHCEEMSGAYNANFALLLFEPGKPVTTVTLKAPRTLSLTDGGTVPSINPSFDAATQTLSTFDKGRGVGDCGTLSEWVWDGTVFELLTYKTMPSCNGIASVDWPTLYQARRK